MASSERPAIITPIGEKELIGSWVPRVGAETRELLEKKLADAKVRASVLESAISILSGAIPPAGPNGAETGLVVGYVQSGKTLSLTTVAALARDNGYQIVIVVAGTSVQLFNQSTERIRADLQIRTDRVRAWALFENPDNTDSMRGNVQRILEEWRDPDVPDEQRQSILIAVMKQHTRLRNVADLLSSLALEDVSALIIDDEADQASLNTGTSQGTQSSTYRRLVELKEVLPSHTLLQYTATPQAPLLINIIDCMSPNFVRVLEPGNSYTGGKQFFQQRSPYIKVIPPQDVATTATPLLEPPASLLEAMRLFMVGVAAGLIQTGPVGCRSMLVHPSHLTAPHQEFHCWIQDIFATWSRELNLPESDPDRRALVEEFRCAYDDLCVTVEDLPPFEQITKALRRAFNRTQIIEVNRRERKPVIVDWSRQYGWILVGGQAMDRGFTVEGLTVTYMPRGIGVGNADTVQQRARFFGHKSSYLGYCRVFMEQQTIDAFRDYVEHEEDIHRQLLKIQNGDDTLNSWKRAFILAPQLRPCRNAVLDFDYMRGRLSDAWLNPQIVLTDAGTIRRNQEVVGSFLGSLAFRPDDGHAARTDIQRHEVCSGVLLAKVLEELLVPYRVTGATDSMRFTGMLLQLGRAVEEHPGELCSVYRMSPGAVRSRSVDEDGQIANLYQGEAPTFPVEDRGTVYPGDRRVRAEDQVSIQVHTLTLTQGEGAGGGEVARGVPVLAVFVPQRMARPWVSQHQAEQSDP
jgi:hypothetical protein